MTTQTIRERLPSCALRCEPIFDTDQDRTATLVELLPLKSFDRDTPSIPFADAYRYLYENGIAQLFGEKPCVLVIRHQEIDEILDIPWPPGKIVACLDVAEDTAPAQLPGLYTKVWEKAYPFVIDTSLYPSLPADRPRPRLAVASPGDSSTHGTRIAPLWLVNVDDRSTAESAAADQGVQWISGRFWKTPAIQPGRTVPASRLGALTLLAELQKPNLTIDEVERIISCDATLSFKLLKLLNSAFFSSPARVDSIRHGVNFFGLQRIKNWATVIVMNSVDFKPREILPLGAYRARLAETLAAAIGHDHPQDYYLVGLFSVLDAMFGTAIDELITPLHLQDAVLRALSSGTGPMGEVLAWMRATEEGESFSAASLANLADIEVLRLQIDALTWTNEFCRSLGG